MAIEFSNVTRRRLYHSITPVSLVDSSHPMWYTIVMLTDSAKCSRMSVCDGER